ncbi:MAG: hypothetical protein JWP25_7266, partial [Bradyrhizobium sp.]|nr:hypothetical protein [Bradyrhizobium sp.]
MIHYVFVAATWLIGVVGVGGAVVTAVAVVYLGPATVMAIVRPIFAKFLACTKCVVAVVFVLSTTAAYWVGHHQAETQCRADELNSKLAAERADTAAQVKAAADEANRAIEI